MEIEFHNSELFAYLKWDWYFINKRAIFLEFFTPLILMRYKGLCKHLPYAYYLYSSVGIVPVIFIIDTYESSVSI